MNKKINNTFGFTLIELMVIISIIGLLSSIVMAYLNGAKAKAVYAKEKAQIRNLNIALKMFPTGISSAPGNYQGSPQGDDGFKPGGGGTLPAIEGSKAYIKSTQELVTANIIPIIPESSTGDKYVYFNYGGSNGEGATFYSKVNCGDTVTGQDGLTYGTVLAKDNKCWLDRNLGASRVATSITDSAAYGGLYQWGRLSDGHDKSVSTSTILSTDDVPGHSNFITNQTTPFDWRATQNNNLWQGVTGTNNPCPRGFRIPTQNEWTTLIKASAWNWSPDLFNSVLKLVYTGYRNGHSGAYGYQAYSAYYWTSTVLGTNAIDFFFGPSYSNPNFSNNYRSDGNSVRCVMD